jgi:DNA-binding SARP family transcriptional activator
LTDGFSLRILGAPALVCRGVPCAAGLRRKDLALLVYLRVEHGRAHPRARLAALLWGETDEDRARHSLTQALGRVQKVLGSAAMGFEHDAVRWTAPLPCDLDWMEGDAHPACSAGWTAAFLDGFGAGAGARDFEEWADGARERVRRAQGALLEGWGAAAEAAGEWEAAWRLADRAVAVDRLREQAHRRLMRALAARGEANLALRHYQDFAAWLDEEIGGAPDAETTALARELRTSVARPAVLERIPEPRIPPVALADVAPLLDTVDAPLPEDAALSHTSSLPRTPAITPQRSAAEGFAAVEEDAEHSGDEHTRDADDVDAARAAEDRRDAADTHFTTLSGRAAGTEGTDDLQPRADPVRRFRTVHAVATALLMLAVVALPLALHRGSGAAEMRDAPAVAPPGYGEVIRVAGHAAAYLFMGDTVYEYPDSATLRACTGGWPDVAREVPTLPRLPRRVLPSVNDRPWMGSATPIVSDHPSDKTAYVAVGCVRVGIPNPPTFESIFGHGGWDRMIEVPDSVVHSLPRLFVARGHPVRPAGTLLRSRDGRVRWILFHGGAADASPRALAAHCRAPSDALAATDAEFNYYRPHRRILTSSGPCAPTRTASTNQD